VVSKPIFCPTFGEGSMKMFILGERWDWEEERCNLAAQLFFKIRLGGVESGKGAKKNSSSPIRRVGERGVGQAEKLEGTGGSGQPIDLGVFV